MPPSQGRCFSTRLDGNVASCRVIACRYKSDEMSLLIVDGYNVAHAWPQTKSLLNAGAPLEQVRRVLVSRLSAHAAATGFRIVVVFDAPARRGSMATDAPAAEVVDGVEIRFGGGAFGSADHLIERLVYDALRQPAAERVRVVTADRLVRDMVRAMGADTIDPTTFEAEIEQSDTETQSRIGRLRQEAGFSRRVEHGLPSEVRAHLEALRRGGSEPPPGAPDAVPAPDPAAADAMPQLDPDAADAVPSPDPEDTPPAPI
jgi:predicted RNA-binding protein with PIN domain